MVVVENRTFQKIVKEGQPKFQDYTTAKSERGWLMGRIKKCINNGRTEEEFIYREILNMHNHFNPAKEVQVEADQWQGKSSIQVLQDIDKITIIKWQKPSKGEEPKEIFTEVQKDELEALVGSIKHILGHGKTEFKSKELAYQYCTRLDKHWKMLEGDFWKNFFNNRRLHNKFTVTLNGLAELDLIEYKGGSIKVLNKDISLQLILN